MSLKIEPILFESSLNSSLVKKLYLGLVEYTSAKLGVEPGLISQGKNFFAELKNYQRDRVTIRPSFQAPLGSKK